MPKRSSKDLPRDVNSLAHELVRRSTEDESKAPKLTKDAVSRVMAAMGRKGGKIGGRRRSETMSPERRREIALKAARARWDKD